MADSDSSVEAVRELDESSHSGRWTRPGVALLGLSLLLWAPLPVVPFLPLNTNTKAAVAGGLVVAAEISFWLGAAMAGPEAAKRIRSWLRRRPKETPMDELQGRPIDD